MSYILVRIEVPGEPVAKGRPRIGINPGTGRAQAFTPAKTRAAESDVKLFASMAMAGRALLDGALVVELTAYRAKGMPGSPDAKPGTKARQRWEDARAGLLRPTTKPDLDNTIKILDALNGVVWTDDALVVRLVAEKAYSDRPRLEIVVFEWT